MSGFFFLSFLICKAKNSHEISLLENFGRLKKITVSGIEWKINVSEKHYQTTVLELLKSSINSLNLFPNLISLSINKQKHDIRNLFLNLTLKKHQFLDISNNLLKTNSFIKNLGESSRIEYLDFSKNLMTSLDQSLYNFQHLKILKILNLKFLALEELDAPMTPNIIEIHLNNTNIIKLKEAHSLLKRFKMIKKCFGDSFRVCCILWKFHGSQVICRPSSKVFSSCSNLLGTTITQILFRFSGLFATIANTINFIFSFLTTKDSTGIYR